MSTSRLPIAPNGTFFLSASHFCLRSQLNLGHIVRMWRAVCRPRPHSQWGDSKSETFRVRRNFVSPIISVRICVSKALSLLSILQWSFKNILHGVGARLCNSRPLMFDSHRWVHFSRMVFRIARFTVPTGLGGLGFPELYWVSLSFNFPPWFLILLQPVTSLPLCLPFYCFLFPYELGSTRGELWSRRFSVCLRIL